MTCGRTALFGCGSYRFDGRATGCETGAGAGRLFTALARSPEDALRGAASRETVSRAAFRFDGAASMRVAGAA